MVDPTIKQIIQFKGKYKKYSGNTKDCTIPEFMKLSKRVKYFRFDAVSGFAQLEEDVPGKEYKDYVKDRKVAAVLKHINQSHEKQLKASEELEQMQKNVDEGKKKFEKLKTEIDKEFPKKSSNPDIEKLKTQIDNDLKELTKIAAQFKQFKPADKDLAKEFAVELRNVETADPGQTKFGKVEKKDLSAATLKKRKGKCEKAFDAVKEESDLAKAAAQAGDKKAAAVNLKACLNELKTVLKYEKIYSKIKKQFKKDIEESDDKKTIEAEIEYFVKKKEGAEKSYEEAFAAVKNAK